MRQEPAGVVGLDPKLTPDRRVANPRKEETEESLLPAVGIRDANRPVPEWAGTEQTAPVGAVAARAGRMRGE